MTTEKVAFVAVTRRGIQQARLLRDRLRAGDLYRKGDGEPSIAAWDHLVDGALADIVGQLFAAYDQLVFFLATGAAVRVIAPFLQDKTRDPGVLAVDEASRFVIPILSGHEGGANRFARTVAGCLGATPIITTATDAVVGLSPDLLADAHGWHAEPGELLKGVALALVNGERVAIVQEMGRPGSWLDEGELPDSVTFATSAANLPADSFAAVLWVTDRLVADRDGRAETRVLWYRPRSLVVGVGCERGITAEALADGLDRFLAEHGFAAASVRTLASLDVKADEAGLLQFATGRGYATEFFTAEQLAAVPGVMNRSAVVERCVGTPGVAEPAALLAAGASALLVPKTVMTSPHAAQRMTFALARHADYRGRPAGRIAFVGAGPGAPELATLKADRLLRQAEVVVYAGSLVPEEMLGRVRPGVPLHNSAFLTLEQTLEIMIPAARAGRRVVRLHSGDTSLYSAIQEQIAVLEDEDIPYEVVPGVSSFQAAAAALASELTLPEVAQTVILTRGSGTTPMPDRESLASLAQHQATLCIFLSARLGDDVQAQLLTAYPPETPVALVHRVTWPDERIVVTTLDRLASELRAQGFQRTTLILVGAALRARRGRSQLYDADHGHIFRKRRRDAHRPPA